ncbi:ABC transporter permease [Halobacillus sp. Marseille-P3879]|uniref:ABC transporter permease n=1 Tax=Halobacillus TaxID=45667 RepID=UPI000C7A5105|nr:ABC transporter permease [Halobacillus sp. Marseille-P3879]
MNKFLIMVVQTFKSRVKSKSFVISTVITLALILLLTNIQSIMEAFESGEEDGNNTTEISVVSEEEGWIPLFEEQLSSAGPFEVEQGQSIEEAREEVEAGELDSALEIEKDDAGMPAATEYVGEQSVPSTSETIQQALQQVKMNVAADQAEVDQAAIEAINSPAAYETVALGEEAHTPEEMQQTQGLVYVMLFLLYLTVMMYGSMIATEVATEKSSRVMEILISSVSPVSQMFAKITGIALLGLLQFSLILGAGYIGILQNGGEGSLLDSFGLSDIQLDVIGYGIVFFILGYFLYATLAATLGSLVSRLEDAQQMIAPMIYLIIIAFFISVFGLNAPDTSFITITSYIPFFSPLIMFLRVGMLDIPAWEIALSIGVLAGSIILLALIGARIYKGGVLMYGKSSSIKDIKQAIQLSKKEN